ncbi:MAG: D-alanine--D-alanine ligase [Gemmatimonadota bacterium]|nr:MAG: D-alanine--D-alanine ligase [Gemmatimonadota bacterium]
MRVAVLTGGSSPERHVALAGGAQVVRALRDLGHLVAVVDTVEGPLDSAAERRLLGASVGRDPPTLDELHSLKDREHPEALATIPELRGADLVFLVLHGQQGEGGEIQALFDLAGITYTGSGPLGSALAMDKDVAKRLFTLASVPTPDWHVWPLTDGEKADLMLPVIVKPSRVGSSVGLTVVRSHTELEAAAELALRYDEDVIVERLAVGREFTVGVLGDRPLAVGEIVPQHETFDYECKYTAGMTEEIFPARIADAQTRQLQQLAIRAHRALKLRDFSRVDFKQDSSGTPMCLEANTLPGLTATSLLPQSAAACGISFGELCEAVCRVALQRARGTKQPTATVD